MRTIDSNVFIALWILSAFTWHVTCKTRSASTGKHTHASNSSNVCNTPACHIRAKFIKAALNNNYKPCDSFYDHVCNNWIFYNPIPDDKSLTSVLNGLDDQLNRDLLRVFENTTYKTERQNVTDKVLASYHNCINTSISEKKQFYALYEVLKRVGGEYWPVWPRPHVREVLPTWDQLFTRIHNEMDINLIFVVGVAKDPNNVTDKIIHLQRPTNPASLQQFRNRHRLQRKVTVSPRDKAYLSLMASCIKTFNPRLSYKKVKEVMLDILWFENNITKIVEAAKNKSTEDVTYYKMTIADLRNISEHVDWLQFFQRLFDPVNITLTPQEPVALSELYYFKTAIDYIMRNTSRYTTYNYMIWRLIRNLGDIALPRFRKLAFRMSQASRGVRRDVPLRERCVDYINEVMDFPAGRLYVQRYFSKEAKKDIVEVVHELKDAFLKSIRKTRWMDRSTKAEALKKTTWSPKLDTLTLF